MGPSGQTRVWRSWKAANFLRKFCRLAEVSFHAVHLRT